MTLLNNITKKSKQNIKQLGVLVDPDKCSPASLKTLCTMAQESGTDYLLVGGSLLTRQNMSKCIAEIKRHSSLPVLIFPGNIMQIEPGADALLFLSLISGRNPEMLIGNHVLAAPMLRNSGLEVIPTGYMLVESGLVNSVMYMSNTTPIPREKTDIAFCTAMAGEMLGLQLIFMDAGSGAKHPVPLEMIGLVKQHISLPLVVGGGIREAETAGDVWEAGADLVIIGNAAEARPGVISQAGKVKEAMNKQR